MRILKELLISAIPKFEFPRGPLDYDLYNFVFSNEDGEEDGG